MSANADYVDALENALADILMSAVLHPQFPDSHECVERPVLDQARMLIDQDLLRKSAERRRERENP